MDTTRTLSVLASAAGRGMLAGVAGTAAMTVSSTLEARLRGRGSSSAPEQAAGTVLGVRPRDEQGERRFSTLAHWGYGTMWGAVRGVIGAATGAAGAPAALAHLLVVWGAEQVVLPSTGAAPPAWRWGAAEVGIDLLHHAVYAAATGAAYDLLTAAAPR
ncbi:hypothetical protein LG943_17260 [Streptomonospora sp. S1-112]|uniref:DUF1440 domain-containing protein n=1 Tax=Streptomonospora mangrovi TaxID=2883123 RepID=A0A9X3NN78_9ACTN|nr:hypothetical protein [Streptomonospora mangrovi]MDA0566050.1 hypothetical protein [Streptomonospora mangrovi]